MSELPTAFWLAALYPTAAALCLVALSPRSWWGPSAGYQRSRFPTFCGYPYERCVACGRFTPRIVAGTPPFKLLFREYPALRGFCFPCHMVTAQRRTAHRWAWSCFQFGECPYPARGALARAAQRVGLGPLAYRLLRACFLLDLWTSHGSAQLYLAHRLYRWRFEKSLDGALGGL